MLSILELILGAWDLLNSADLIVAAFAGWRYLLSSTYRAHTYERWRCSSRWLITFDILGALFGMAASLFLLGLLASYVFGLGWFRPTPHLP